MHADMPSCETYIHEVSCKLVKIDVTESCLLHGSDMRKGNGCCADCPTTEHYPWLHSFSDKGSWSASLDMPSALLPTSRLTAELHKHAKVELMRQ